MSDSVKLLNPVAVILLLIAGFMSSEVSAFGCYNCWSNVSANCATGPVVGQNVGDCAGSDQTCVTAIVDGNTYRGCSASITLPTDYKLKTLCNAEYCNADIYPSDRLDCYKCLGNECNSPRGNSRPCVNYVENDECYTDVISETNTRRGCMSDGNFTATEYTATCDTDLCNNQISVSTFECIQCSSNETAACIRSPAIEGQPCQIAVTTKCQIQSLLGRNDSCYTYHSGDLVQRGCTQGESDSEIINHGRLSTECHEDSCNNECIPPSVCYVCNSTENPSCISGLNGLQPEVCTSEAIASCFTCLGEDGSVERGCGSRDDDINQCSTCSDGEDGCNRDALLQCYSCSSESDPDCAERIDPNQSAGNYSIIACSTNCIALNMNDDYVLRGCETPDLNCDQTSQYCVSCNTTLCNYDSIDIATLKCYQCSNCPNIDGNTILGGCQNHTDNDQCVQFVINGIITRGCLSDHRQECLENEESCLQCDSSGCNNLPLYKSSNLSCVQCDSRSEISCGWGMNPNHGEDCKDNVYYYQNQSCYSENRDGTIWRGCTFDNYCTAALPAPGANCSTCITNNCNNENYIWQSCLQCSSENDGNCETGKDIISTICPGMFQTYDERGCYVKWEGNDTIRGCLISLNDTDRDICTSNAPGCVACQPNGCNIQNIPDSSVQLEISLTIFLLTTLFNLL